MANNYESLKTDGHYTMARRIFMKIKSWAEPKSVPITWANYQALVNAGTDNPNVNYMIIDGISGALLDCFYPVGSYYETSNTSFDPNVSFGGTWVLETEGLVHVSSGSNYAVTSNAKDGGEANINLQHNHTVNNHSHTLGAGYAMFDASLAGWMTFRYKSVGSWTPNWRRTFSTPSAQTVVADTDAISLGGRTDDANPSTDNKLSTTQSVMQPYKIVNRWHRTA